MNNITKFFASLLTYGVTNKKKRFSAIGRFSEGLAPVKGKIQWGYINKGYDVVIPLMYERAFSFKEGLGMVILNSQYGFIDHTGEVQIPFKYTAAPHSFEQECARVCHDRLWGLIDREGNYILPPTYSQIEQFAEGLALVSLHNKVGFINKKGEVVIPLVYDNGRSFSEGLTAVCIEGQSSKWGYINKDNQEVLPFKYDIAEPFYNNIARVSLYGKSMKINKQGSECL